MRIAHSAFVTLLAVSAVPSIGSAQVLDLGAVYGYDSSLDRAVPVATVSLVGDIVALDGARTVHDSYGEPFVLGSATLDVSVPYRAKIVFKITNATEMPIPLKDVIVYERTMVAAKDRRGVAVGAPYLPLSAAGIRAAHPRSGDELQSGATLTVEMPISQPYCRDKNKADCTADGFIVFVGRKLPQADVSTVPSGEAWVGENPLFTRAFLALLSQTQH